MFKIFLSKSPFLRLLLPFILGIWFASEYAATGRWIIMPVLFLLLLYVWFVWWYRQKPDYAKGFWSGVLSTGFLITFGIGFYALRSPHVIDFNQTAGLKVQVRSWIGQTSRNNSYEVQLMNVDTILQDKVVGKKGIIYISKKQTDEHLLPGEVINVTGRFLPYSKPLVPHQFDYSNYLKNNRIAFRMIVYQMQKCHHNNKAVDIPLVLSQFKTYVIRRFSENGIGKEELAILNAMFLGDKAQISNEQKEAFIKAGAMHLLAISGLHVGIIYLLLSFFISRLFTNKVVAFIAVFMLLWVYAILTGFSASVLRATIMFSVIEVARLSRRQISIVNLLAVSMFIILLIDPLYLFSVGFWLSHCAVASIVLFYPFFDRLVYFGFPPFRWLWSILGLSVTAQLGALPVSMMFFHQFSPWFVVSNWLLMPVVTPVMLLAMTGLVFSSFNTVLMLVLPALNDLLGFMNQVVVWIQQLPYASFQSIPFQWYHMILLFACLTVFLISLEQKTILSLRWVLILVIGFVVSIHIHRLMLPKESLICISTGKGVMVNYFNSSINELYTSSSMRKEDVKFLWSGMWSVYGVDQDVDCYQTCNQTDSVLTIKQICGKNIMFVRGVADFMPKPKGVKVDCIVDLRNKHINRDELLALSDEVMFGNKERGSLIVQKKLWSESVVFLDDTRNID